MTYYGRMRNMAENYNDNNDLNSEDLFNGNNHSREENVDDINDNKSSEVSFASEPNSYSYTSESSKKKCRKNLHFFMKSSAAVLAVIILGAGTVQIYKFLRDTREELVELSNDASAKTVSKEIDDKDKAHEELPSLIELASRSDAKPLPDIVDAIMPSVVGVASSFEFEQQQSFSMWGWNTEPLMQSISTTGTGFIISEDGYIVTNCHVVFDTQYNAGEATEVSVLFSDETQHEANIVAYDLETDIAVLKVDEKGLTPAVIGDSDELRVGELVIAVGNPLGFDLFGTVTSGIVSALNRKIDINEKKMNLIQTDAAINSGNSGGPLLNSCGQVIGINSAKMSSSYNSNAASIEGICFAIPMKEAKVIIDDLINFRYVTGRPQIGINTSDIDEIKSRFYNVPMGVLIRAIEDGSAADLAGLMVGDIILEIEGESVTTRDKFNEIKNQHKVGDVITLTVYRDGKEVKVKVTLQEQKNIRENVKPET